MLNQYTFNFTLEIASPIIALEMDFLKEEVFFICSLYIFFLLGELKCWRKSYKTSFPNASGSSLFGCFIVEQCFKTVSKLRDGHVAAFITLKYRIYCKVLIIGVAYLQLCMLNTKTNKSLCLSMSDTTVTKGWRRKMLAHTASEPCTEHMCYGMVLQASSQNMHKM